MEFEKIIELLESNDRSNVRLALQLAQNYQAEFEEHYGATVADCQAMVEWVWEYLPYTENPFLARELDFSDKDLAEIPPQIAILKQLRVLYLRRNRLTELPSAIGQLPGLSFLYLLSNPISVLHSKVLEGLSIETQTLFENIEQEK